MAKLILEALEELDLAEVTPQDLEADMTLDGGELGLELNPELSETEKEVFQTGVTSDLLAKELEVFGIIKTHLDDPALEEGLRIILESVCDDTALIIGKLQQCVKEAVSEKTEDLINQGEEESVNTDEEIKVEE